MLGTYDENAKTPFALQIGDSSTTTELLLSNTTERTPFAARTTMAVTRDMHGAEVGVVRWQKSVRYFVMHLVTCVPALRDAHTRVLNR